MGFLLVVTRSFGAFRRGDVVEGMTAIDQILNSEHAAFVVRVAATLYPGV